MSLTRAPPLIFPAAAGHAAATFIFLHGLGDSGYSWGGEWHKRLSRNSKLRHVKLIFPNAPNIPITCNGGMQMPGWYDIFRLDGDPKSLRAQQDEAGMNVTRAYLHGLIDSEIDSGVKSERIVLGGFSQGGAMSIYSGLTAGHKLGGVVGLSSYLPLDATFPKILEQGDLNKKTPIFMGHGTQDLTVPYAFGKESASMLEKLGFDVKFESYPGLAHSVDEDELDTVIQLLERVFTSDEGKESKPEL